MKVIQKIDDPDLFYAEGEGWVSREYADEYSDDAAKDMNPPVGGQWAPETTGRTYKVVRFFSNEPGKRETIKEGLSWDEAREHCSDPDSKGDGWFDGFERED